MSLPVGTKVRLTGEGGAKAQYVGCIAEIESGVNSGGWVSVKIPGKKGSMAWRNHWWEILGDSPSPGGTNSSETTNTMEENERLRQLISQLYREAESYEADKKQSIDAKDRMRKEYAQQLETHHEEKRHLARTIESLNATNQQTSDALRDVKQELSEKIREIETLKENLDNTKKMSSQKTDALIAQVEATEKSLQEENKVNFELQKEKKQLIERLEKQQEESKQRIEKCEAIISNLLDEKNQLTKQLEDAVTILASEQEEKTQLVKRLEKVQNEQQETQLVKVQTEQEEREVHIMMTKLEKSNVQEEEQNTQLRLLSEKLAVAEATQQTLHEQNKKQSEALREVLDKFAFERERMSLCEGKYHLEVQKLIFSEKEKKALEGEFAREKSRFLEAQSKLQQEKETLLVAIHLRDAQPTTTDSEPRKHIQMREIEEVEKENLTLKKQAATFLREQAISSVDSDKIQLIDDTQASARDNIPSQKRDLLLTDVLPPQYSELSVSAPPAPVSSFPTEVKLEEKEAIPEAFLTESKNLVDLACTAATPEALVKVLSETRSTFSSIKVMSQDVIFMVKQRKEKCNCQGNSALVRVFLKLYQGMLDTAEQAFEGLKYVSKAHKQGNVKLAEERFLSVKQDCSRVASVVQHIIDCKFDVSDSKCACEERLQTKRCSNVEHYIDYRISATSPPIRKEFYGKHWEEKILLTDPLLFAQPTQCNHLDFLLANARRIETNFNKFLSIVASGIGICKFGGVKSEERCRAKIVEYAAREMEPASAQLKDILRASIVCQRVTQILKGIESLKNIVCIKDRLQLPTHDVLVNFVYANTICEVQFHLESFYQLKVFSHGPYQVTRATKYTDLLDRENGELLLSPFQLEMSED